MKYIILAIIIGGLAISARSMDISHRQTIVYNTCMKAHNETNEQSEQHCADVQVQYKYEFLCDKTGNNCWVEKNNDLLAEKPM